MKCPLLFLILWVFLPVPALAANFTAAIDSDHVGQGDSFTLQLTLSGAKATGAPDIDALRQSFTVVSESQSSNTININGAASSRQGWQLTLIPRRQGRLVIPPVAIETDASVLRSAPVTLEVDNGPALASSQTGRDGSMVSITARAGTATPYQNQPIPYTVRCVVRGNVSDVSLGDISVSNAIVQRQGKPDVRDQVENGVAVRVAEFHYIITPLQSGKITIPPVVLQGKIQAPDFAAMADPFGGGFSTTMRQVMNFFSTYAGQPFSVASNVTLLDVKPPAAAMDPWLPLTSLKIMEDTDVSQPVQVGEPLTRKITLLAEGAVGSQLPNIEAQQNHVDFKVYADKPTMGEDIDKKSGAILGWRKESYSLIAQKSGRVVLPMIRVSWWNIVNNKVATTELPARVVNVQPGTAVQTLPVAGFGGARQGMKRAQSAPTLRSWAKSVPADIGSPFLFSLFSIAVVLLLFAAFWWLRRRRISRLTSNDASAAPAIKSDSKRPASRRVDAGRLKQVRTAEELKTFLQFYACEHWGVSKNASLEKIFSALPNSRVGQESGDVQIVIKGITAALYAGKAIEIEDLKKRCRRIIAAPRSDTDDNLEGGEKLPNLNPS